MAYSDTIMADGAAVLWKFNETPDAGVQDILTATNDGVYSGVITEYAGNIDSITTALPLFGSGNDTEAMVIGDGSNPPYLNPSLGASGTISISLEFWFKVASGATGEHTLIAINAGAGYLNAVHDALLGRLILQASNPNQGGGSSCASSNASIVVDTVYHVVMSWESGSGALAIRINGVTDGTGMTPFGASFELPCSSTGLIQCKNIYTLQALAIYRSVVSEATALSHYTAGITPETDQYETVSDTLNLPVTSLSSSLIFNPVIPEWLFTNDSYLMSYAFYDGFTMNCIAALGDIISDSLADVLIAIDSEPGASVVHVLSEVLMLPDSLVRRTVESTLLRSSVDFRDVNALFFTALVQDNLNTGSDSLTPLRESYLRVLDRLSHRDLNNASQNLSMTLSVTLALIDLSNRAHNFEINDGLSLSHALDSLIRYYTELMDNLSLSISQLSNSALILPVISDSTSFEDGLTRQLNVRTLIEDDFSFAFYFNNDNESYTGWVMNATNIGVSNYSDYNFNSVAKIGNNYYGASQTGIYKLTGTDDAVTVWKAKTGAMTIAGSNKSRVPEAFIGVANNGRIVFKTITGKQEERWYELRSSKAEMDVRRVKMGRGVTSHYWQFSLENIDGTDTDLDYIELRPVKLTRRV